MIDRSLDGGRPFDWGRTSADYARFRDIYPPEFYDRILVRGLATAGQAMLDLGTGTGVLPRHLYRHGASWTAADASPEQIAAAKELSRGMDITYHVSAAEDVALPPASLDGITACQCFWYFDHERLAPRLFSMLKPGGRLLVLYMAWLPFEDPIAGASERLILRYSPQWSGAGETVRPIAIPTVYDRFFERVSHEEYRLDVPFTRESWHGRVRACRAVGASLPPETLAQWDAEHRRLLDAIAPVTFTVRHYAALAELRVKK